MHGVFIKFYINNFQTRSIKHGRIGRRQSVTAEFFLDKTQTYKCLGMQICSHVRQVRHFWLFAGKLASL